MQNHGTSELSLAFTAIAIGFGKIVELLIKAEPVLASLSYIVAMIAGLVTVYYKLKRKG
jgi:hypothetical protein